MVGVFDTPDISDLFRGSTVPRRKPATGKQRLVFLHTLTILLVLVLHIREEHEQVFLSKFLPVQTTPVKQQRRGLCHAE